MISSKLKVLFIIHLPPPVHGASMAGNFIKTSTFINNSLDTTYINLATNKKLAESGKAGFRKIFTFFELLLKILITLSSRRFDICHMTLTSSGPGFYKDIIVVSLLKAFRVKILYHFHNKGIEAASSSSINRALYRFVFKGAKVILLSPSLYSDVSRYVKKEDVFYCPNGIPDSHDPVPIAQADNTGFPCQFLYLSNMMAEKGVYILLESLAMLRDKQVNFDCHFIGGWASITPQDFQQKLQEYRLTDHVFAHGPQYGQDKEIFFDKADVFVFPTFYHFEAFPIVALEAMHKGLPVVSTPEGGIPDIISDGQTGFMVPQRNAAALAEKLEILAQNPGLRKQMGEEGKRKFQNSFTLKHFENRITEILKQASSL